MKKISITTLVLIFAACASKKQPVAASNSQADFDRGAAKFTGYTFDLFTQGHTLYQQHSGNCHGLKNPASRNEAQWKRIVPEMAIKVNKKENNVLTADKEELILKYCVTMSLSREVK